MSNSPLVTYTNLTKNHSGKRKNAIDRISIHCIVGQWTAKQGCDYFANTDRECSANYVVGKDGSIGLSVDEANRSWCTSSAANDNRAITIETASDTKHPYAVTDKAYAALIDLVTDICKRNGKTKLLWFGDKAKTLAYKPAAHEMVMTVHRWFAAKACPGEYLYERHGAIAEEVNKRLAAGTTQATQSTKQELYRVREAWDKPKSQKGAYKVLANAKKTADKYGLNVYNSAGEKVYPEGNTAPKEEPKKEPTQKVAYAKSHDASAAKGVRFTVNSRAGLNVRRSPEIPKDNPRENILKAVPHGTVAFWYGYYTGDWYLVQFADKSTGYVHKQYLRKV